MIPVKPQPEPNNFFETVSNPGNAFLRIIHRPLEKEWTGNEYWRNVLPEMRSAYKRVCAYCAHWIPHSTGTHSIDHFIPKSVSPHLAYEWSNFRYVSAKFNSRKGIKVILDPFKIQGGWFIIDFTSFLIKPNPHLLPEQKQQILDTINILKLNSDERLVQERQGWIEDFLSGQCNFEFLEEKVPFIAFELRRQGGITDFDILRN